MYIERRERLHRVDSDGTRIPGSETTVITSTQQKIGDGSSCKNCILYPSHSRSAFSGCGGHVCGTFSWRQQVNEKVEEFAEEHGYVRDAYGLYFINISNSGMEFLSFRSDMPIGIVRWRKL